MNARTAWAALVLIFIGGLGVAFASDETPRDWSVDSQAAPPLAPLLDGDQAYVRTQSIQGHFGIAPEEVSDPIPVGFVSPEAFARRLKVFDPTGVFSRFSNSDEVSRGATALRVFEDPRSLRRLDFEMSLNSGATERFHERLLAAGFNAQERPLSGLRIALDPGHMGGSYWDRETGKFVRTKDGRILSEGLMVLQLSLLLEKQFRDLGAEVMLTHRNLAPVTDASYPKLDLKDCEQQELRASWLEPWFQSLLVRGDAGTPALFGGFDASSEVHKIFSERMRWSCFVEREDLDARVRAIEAFEPDLVLILHLDSDDPSNDPNGLNPRAPRATKAYVPGYHAYEELATREQRRHFAAHLVSPQSWDASVALSRAVVRSIAAKLGVEREASPAGQAVVIEPGVQGRNLRVLRKVTGAAVSYIEGLYYNNPAEFDALSATDHSMQIDGSSYPYSERLDSLADAIRAGVVEFVRNYGE